MIPPFSFHYKQNNVKQNINYDYGTEDTKTEVRTFKSYRHFFVPICIRRELDQKNPPAVNGGLAVYGKFNHNK
ncbi:hypothetical protein CHCC15087_4065 [Bacillus licheniformis]|nr:hypothetical protein CHCC15087_4065 [Bacillus licheniformis]